VKQKTLLGLGVAGFIVWYLLRQSAAASSSIPVADATNAAPGTVAKNPSALDAGPPPAPQPTLPINESPHVDAAAPPSPFSFAENSPNPGSI
jgi:hypothetical protein